MHETIYQALYGHLGVPCVASSPGPADRPARRRPHRQATGAAALHRTMVMVSERPAEAADRAVPGHWEGDRATRSRTVEWTDRLERRLMGRGAVTGPCPYARPRP